MRKLIILLISIIYMLNINFSQKLFETYIGKYAGFENLSIHYEIEFDINYINTIEGKLFYIKNRFIVIKIETPDLFSGITYVYDMFNKSFYTRYDSNLDYYDEISILVQSVPMIFENIMIAFDPSKFDSIYKKDGEFYVNYLEPKSKAFLRIINVDFVKFQVFFRNPYEEVYIFDRMKITNSNESKNIIIKMHEISLIPNNEVMNLLDQFLDITNSGR